MIGSWTGLYLPIWLSWDLNAMVDIRMSWYKTRVTRGPLEYPKERCYSWGSPKCGLVLDQVTQSPTTIKNSLLLRTQANRRIPPWKVQCDVTPPPRPLFGEEPALWRHVDMYFTTVCTIEYWTNVCYIQLFSQLLTTCKHANWIQNFSKKWKPLNLFLL